MTKEERDNLTLIERLEYDIAFDEKHNLPLDRIDWRYEYGVAVTVNEAKLFAELLKSIEKVYILIRSDRRGRDAVELCFKTKEAAEAYLQAERQSMTYDEDLYDIIEEKILTQ